MRLVLALVLVAGCRIGFDDLGAGAADDAGSERDDASRTGPPAPTCAGGCGAQAYCQAPTGLCSGSGTCAPRPGSCIPVNDPVCGCDGVTYANPCEAELAGISLEHVGACLPSPQGPVCDPPCAVGEYCYTPPGVCGSTGTCAIVPDISTCQDVQVCGCDGVNYGTACEAAGAGVSVRSLGTCPF